MFNWRTTCLPALDGESKITTLFEAALNITYEFGFEYCAFTMSSHLQNHPTQPVHINNYPTQWNTLYKQENYYALDPIVAHCKRSVLPIVWQENIFSAVPDLWVRAQAHGVNEGWSQSVHDFQGMFSMLTLARHTGPVSPEELYEKAGQVLWLCHAMHASVAQQFTPAPPARPAHSLSPREIDVLRWSAMGKTAAEIAQILCLSERTVGFHSQHAMQKLGVNNKIAAVITAVKAGLF